MQLNGIAITQMKSLLRSTQLKHLVAASTGRKTS
jgi:hypothetical protein